jgi:hypothetical protein
VLILHPTADQSRTRFEKTRTTNNHIARILLTIS